MADAVLQYIEKQRSLVAQNMVAQKELVAKLGSWPGCATATLRATIRLSLESKDEQEPKIVCQEDSFKLLEKLRSKTCHRDAMHKKVQWLVDAIYRTEQETNQIQAKLNQQSEQKETEVPLYEYSDEYQ